MKRNIIKTASCIATVFTIAGCAHTSNTVGIRQTIPKTNLDHEPPRLVSAFFGLDDALPKMAAQFSAEAPGKDGMPVTFSRRVMDGPSVNPKAFTVKTRSGALRQRSTPRPRRRPPWARATPCSSSETLAAPRLILQFPSR